MLIMIMKKRMVENMAEGKVKFGLIGCGNVSSTYLYILKNNRNSELIAIAEENPERLRYKANLFGVDKIYTNYRDMLDNDFLDAVVIATPPYAHKEQALYCARKGLDILCEKPLSITQKDVEEIIEGCKDVKTSVMLQRRFYPVSKSVKEAVEKGLFGEIKNASIKSRCNKSDDFYNSWRGKRYMAGGGALISQTLSRIDQMVYFFGNPRAVEGIMRTTRQNIEVEDYAKGTIYFDNGIIVNVETNTSDPESRGFTFSFIRIDGTKGNCVLSDDKALLWMVSGMDKPANGNLEMIPEEYRPMYYGPCHEIIINDFVDAVKNNRRPLVSMEDSLLDMKVIFGFYESARNNGEKVLL